MVPYNATILLTEKISLNSSTQDQLRRLGVKKVFIVGGIGVVGPEVQSAL